MKNFDNKHGRENNNPRERSFKKDLGNRFGSRDKERPQMHEATCSDCGKRCEVPFRPTGDKPVYCSQCFNNHGGGANASGFEKKSYERPRTQERKMFDTICDKCGKRFELPFKPNGDQSVFCNDCFDKGGSSGSRGSSNDRGVNQYKEQLDAINIKLDKIINALVLIIPEKKEKEAAKMAVVTEEIVVEKKKVSPKKAVVKKTENVVVKKAEKVIVKKPTAKKKTK